jgi:uncharacterized protein involved in cysteine biosynthesis
MVKPAGSGFSEALRCMALGFRDGLKARVAFISLGIWVGSIALWLQVFYAWHKPMMAGTARGLGWLWQLTTGKLPPTGTLLENLAGALVIVGLLLACLFTVQIAIELILMKRLQQHCLRHYPSLEAVGEGSTLRAMRDSLKMFTTLMTAAPLAFVPVLGAVLLFALGTYNSTRSMVNDALDGIARDHERQAVFKQQRATMVALGLCGSMLMLVPLAGLFVPSIMGAAACHFSMRQVVSLRAAAARA